MPLEIFTVQSLAFFKRFSWKLIASDISYRDNVPDVLLEALHEIYLPLDYLLVHGSLPNVGEGHVSEPFSHIFLPFSRKKE